MVEHHFVKFVFSNVHHTAMSVSLYIKCLFFFLAAIALAIEDVVAEENSVPEADVMQNHEIFNHPSAGIMSVWVVYFQQLCS